MRGKREREKEREGKRKREGEGERELGRVGGLDRWRDRKRVVG